MMKKWTDKIKDGGTDLPKDVEQAFSQAASIIHENRLKLSKKLEEPMNVLIGAAAASDLSREQRAEIVSTTSYLLSGIGLAFGFPPGKDDQKAPLGTPSSMMLKGARGSSWLVLRTRTPEGGMYQDSPALTPKRDRPTPHFQLVESITTSPWLNRDRAKRSLGID